MKLEKREASSRPGSEAGQSAMLTKEIDEPTGEWLDICLALC
jgi:hypothetical protein